MSESSYIVPRHPQGPFIERTTSIGVHLIFRPQTIQRTRITSQHAALGGPLTTPLRAKPGCFDTSCDLLQFLQAA